MAHGEGVGDYENAATGFVEVAEIFFWEDSTCWGKNFFGGLKHFVALAVIALTFSIAAPVFAAHAPKITSKEMKMYFFDVKNVSTGTVYFIGNSDVPYFSLKDCGELYTALKKIFIHQGQNVSFDLKFSKSGEVGTLTRTDGNPYTMTVDCAADKITFLDYDAFVRPDESRVLLDILSVDDPRSDDEVNFFRRTKDSYERYGDELILDLGKYGIDLVADDKDCYIPAQTFSDFLLSTQYVNLFYNGEAFFLASYNGMSAEDDDDKPGMEKLFYSVKPKKISADMAKFNYAELCLAFDNLYGLKEVHGIDSFDNLCRQTGYDEILSDTDSDARKKFYPDGVPAYEEIGNTAYITFDSFKGVPEGVDYYQTPPNETATDTIGAITYAYSQIMRENSPIENVVLDLSCNLGGESDMAVYTVSAFLGEGYASVKNTMTNALATGVYNVDMNFDHKYNSDDRGLLSKKIFCIISPVSFSCGNLVPNVFKNSNAVTLIGRTSGGGSCVVLPMTTACGTGFQLSGPMRLAFLKNGSFYDIDRGAEPDCPLMFPESFYNRAELTKLTNGIK